VRFVFDKTSLGCSVKITFEELKDVSVTSGGRSYTAMLASGFDFEHRVFYQCSIVTIALKRTEGHGTDSQTNRRTDRSIAQCPHADGGHKRT